MEEKMPRLDKRVLTVAPLTGDDGEKSYWLKKSPEERFNAIEICRKMVYGKDGTSSRLQRFLEVVKLARR